jgi:putative peptidoglycan lipid II flippase
VKLGPLTTGRVVAGVAGAAAMIALVNVVSRLVGFVRQLVMLNQVGADAFGNAYTSANTLPNVLFEVVAGGALAGAVVPLIAAPLARAMRRDVDRTASALLGWALAVLVPLAVAVALAARPLVGLFMQGRADAEVDVAATFLATFAPQIPLYGVGLVLTGVLQAQRRFLAAALAPVLNSAVVIAVFIAFGRLVPGTKDDPAAVADAAVALLGWGTTAGVAMMSLPLLWPVHRTGVRLRPTLTFPDGVASRARSLALAGIGALIAQQVSVLAALSMANAHGGRGTWPVFISTQAVYLLPYAVLAFPLATATLPRLAERAATGDTAGFAALTSRTTRAVLLVTGVGAAVLVAAAPAVEQVFVPIAEGSVAGMGGGLTAMAPGLLGFALILHLSRALYSLHRGRTAVTATAAGWLVVGAATVLVVPALTDGGRDQVATLRGLGIASAVGMTVAGVGLVLGVVRAAGAPAVAGVARTAGVVTLGGAAGAWAGRLATTTIGYDSTGRALVAGVVGALVVALAVIALAWALDRSVLRTLRDRNPEPSPESLAGGGPVVR